MCRQQPRTRLIHIDQQRALDTGSRNQHNRPSRKPQVAGQISGPRNTHTWPRSFDGICLCPVVQYGERRVDETQLKIQRSLNQIGCHPENVSFTKAGNRKQAGGKKVQIPNGCAIRRTGGTSHSTCDASSHNDTSWQNAALIAA